MFPEQLNSKRLLLDPPRVADVPALIRLMDDPLIVEMTNSIPSPYGEADAVRFLHKALEGRNNGTSYVFAIRLPGEDAIMGGVGLHLSPHYSNAEIGYWLGAPYRGSGYVSEAIGILIDAGFEHTQVTRIHAITRLHNTASAKALLANGMVLEAKFDDFNTKNGEVHSVNQYRILRRNWTASHTQDANK